MTKWNKEEKLKAPFKKSEIEWRILKGGMKDGKPWAKVAAYIDARAVQERLDEIIGPTDWQDHYTHEPQGVMCQLAIRTKDNDWVSKSDGADPPEWESFKGSISGALRRAASKWGVGRYLYDLENGYAKFVEKGTPGARYQYDKTTGKAFYWLPPELPKWAYSDSDSETTTEQPTSVPDFNSGEDMNEQTPAGDYTVPIGKYRGKTVAEVYAENPDYLSWVIQNLEIKPGKFAESNQLFKNACEEYLIIKQEQDEPQEDIPL